MELEHKIKTLLLSRQEASGLFYEYSQLPEFTSILTQICNSIILAITYKHKLLIAGNGGSFSDAQHMAAEFVSRFSFDRVPFPALALGTNISSFSAVANDYTFEYVFTRELEAYANVGDILLLISTSGESRNILSAAQYAINNKMTVYGLTGNQDSTLRSLVPCLQIPFNQTALIQEYHIIIEHIISQVTEEMLSIINT